MRQSFPSAQSNLFRCARFQRGGFTLLEVIAAIAILAVLAVIVLRGYGPIQTKAESVACLTHMRSLHTSLATYIQDKGMWPQEPEDSSSEQIINEDWWLAELAPYGAPPDVWLCPTIKRLSSLIKDKKIAKVHYVPQAFDELPSSPYKYSTQPWLIELAGMHGRGPNICFPDGSIRAMDDLLKK